ncbi:MAG: hypothetical protein EAY68_10005 [Bacteroidetes bacterium]|nr:MAG: hypothetical protein EAY68_10005 [Bacteroidota bacterium]
MKKFLAVALMMGAFVGANAANHGEKNVVTPKIIKTISAVEEWNCGTASTTVEGGCWTGTATVTACCECGQVEATILATVLVKKEVPALTAVVSVLNMFSGCQ